jgi:hypothetical protein
MACLLRGLVYAQSSFNICGCSVVNLCAAEKSLEGVLGAGPSTVRDVVERALSSTLFRKTP